MLRWRETRRTRTSDILATRAKTSVLWTEKENLRKKSSWLSTRLFCEQKISLACLSCNSDDSPACAKAFFSALRNKKGWDTAGFQERKFAVFLFACQHIEDALPSTSHCTCRLNNVHTYQTTTHLQSHCHMLLSSGTFYFHRSNVLTSRLAASCCVTPGGTGTRKCTQARRPSPCRATWRSGTCSCCRCK